MEGEDARCYLVFMGLENILTGIKLHGAVVVLLIIAMAAFAKRFGETLGEGAGKTIGGDLTGENFCRASVLICLAFPFLSCAAQIWCWLHTDLFSPIVLVEPQHVLGREFMRRSDWTILAAMQLLLAMPSLFWLMGERSPMLKAVFLPMAFGWIAGAAYVGLAITFDLALVSSQVPPFAVFSATGIAWWFSATFSYALMAALALQILSHVGQWLWGRTA
jgi:hypothetical protein